MVILTFDGYAQLQVDSNVKHGRTTLRRPQSKHKKMWQYNAAVTQGIHYKSSLQSTDAMFVARYIYIYSEYEAEEDL